MTHSPTTSEGLAAELERAAVELLAAAYEGDGRPITATDLRCRNIGPQGVRWVRTECALTAILAALNTRATPPVDTPVEGEIAALVEQCDREAAADSYRRRGFGWKADQVLTGGYDDNIEVQTFARHRVQGLTTLSRQLTIAQGEAEALRRENAEARRVIEDVADPLAHLRRYAEEQGARLDGAAYAIANDLGFVKGIARAFLASKEASDAS
jgi:hypothetical protein